MTENSSDAAAASKKDPAQKKKASETNKAVSKPITKRDIGIATFLLLAGVGIVIGLLVAGGGDDKDSVKFPPRNSTAILQMFEEISPSAASSLSSVDAVTGKYSDSNASPQARAADYILNIDPCGYYENDPVLSFVYSLTVLKLSIGGSMQMSPQICVHPCDWDGVICNNRRRNARELHFRSQATSSNDGSTIPDKELLLFSDELRILDLSNNHIGGTIPQSIRSISFLRELKLSGNKLSGALPLESSDKLRHLNLSNNSFSGSVSEFLEPISSISELSFLSIKSNKGLVGDIPTFILDLTRLTDLQISSNSFYGAIPNDISKLSMLINFDISGNEFVSPIPTTLFHPSMNLESLALNDNLFRQTIPTEVAQLEKLEILYLHGNDFSGTVPTEIGLMKNLETFYLQNTNLSGVMPPQLCALYPTSLVDLWADCGTSPDIICDCCTECFSFSR